MMSTHAEPSKVEKLVVASSQEDQSSPAELERLRSELELLGYIASHDLQAPARIITRYCEELAAKPAIMADEESRINIERITHQAAHMKALLEGMLEYVRLETFEVKHTLLDSNELVAAAMEALHDEIKNTGATVTCDTLPEITGHRGRLTRLFAHLLDNALKFRGVLPPIIHIGAKRQGNRWEFCVEDNGIGIDKEFHTIIFTLFQRLHTEDAYPGIGAGLALSRKIVASHGGELQVESTPGNGSRFVFTLPAQNLKEETCN